MPKSITKCISARTQPDGGDSGYDDHDYAKCRDEVRHVVPKQETPQTAKEPTGQSEKVELIRFNGVTKSVMQRA